MFAQGLFNTNTGMPFSFNIAMLSDSYLLPTGPVLGVMCRNNLPLGYLPLSFGFSDNLSAEANAQSAPWVSAAMRAGATHVGYCPDAADMTQAEMRSVATALRMGNLAVLDRQI